RDAARHARRAGPPEAPVRDPRLRRERGAPRGAHRRLLPEGLPEMTRILLLLVSAALAACSDGDAKQAKKADTPAAIAVSVLQVAPRDVPVAFEAVGRTEGSREIQVRARVAGILEQQLFNEGEPVQ